MKFGRDPPFHQRRRDFVRVLMGCGTPLCSKESRGRRPHSLDCVARRAVTELRPPASPTNIPRINDSGKKVTNEQDR
jgi:hypothetical protein